MAERDFTCGLDVALAVVGGRWKPLVLFQLGGGPRRFGEVRRLVGVAEKVLIQPLRELEGDGILSRRDYREVPPRVECAMTAFGRTLAAALMPLSRLGRREQGADRGDAAEGEGDGRVVGLSRGSWPSRACRFSVRAGVAGAGERLARRDFERAWRKVFKEAWHWHGENLRGAW